MYDRKNSSKYIEKQCQKHNSSTRLKTKQLSCVENLKERVSIIKLALANNIEVEADILHQSKEQILNEAAKDYGKNIFAELSNVQQDEILNDTEAQILVEANKIIQKIRGTKKNMKKTAQSSWWSENRYGDRLSKKEQTALRNRINDIFASKRTWPRATLVNNEATEKILVDEFMDRFLNKLVPFRDDSYIEDDNVLHVCVAVFLRNYPQLQAQYSASFIPLQKVREAEEEAQSKQEPNPFFSEALQERTAQALENIDFSDAQTEAVVLQEGTPVIVKRKILDRDGKPVLAGEYSLVDPPLEENGAVVISIVPEIVAEDYTPNDICFVTYPNEDIEIVTS